MAQRYVVCSGVFFGFFYLQEHQMGSDENWLG